ncbi:ABC transporter permease [Ensifer sp. YR511]|uniref:ABC transporter permease n=1 Tax=Ensifer sp. YR511 TaxID=1855294 RepID=UPI00088AA305|nr:ABC transporter permease [Ensifer sp. YR511]SDN39381.1 peptide/nickel transport system permease protein [Ensifer sp. YR511]
MKLKLSIPAAISLSIIVVIIVSGLLAPYLAPYVPTQIDPLNRLEPPSVEHLFGTDNLGRDIFSRVLYGTQVSLLVAVAVPILTGLLGLLFGLLAGFVRPLDGVIMRIMDGIMAIPEMLLAIALAAMFSARIEMVVVAIAVPEIPRTTRLVRGLVLSIREMLYVEAAISMGASFTRILFRHVAPNTIAPLLVQMVYVGALAVLVEAYLSFLGVGVPPDMPSWGNVVAQGRDYISVSPWGIVFPGLLIALLVLSANIVLDDLRDDLERSSPKTA